ncbi:MAG: hypothetical protein ACJ8AI_08605 [Rhodopila sp.]
MSEESADNLSLVHSLIQEVRLLLDFVSGRVDRRLKDLKICGPALSGAPGTPEMLAGNQLIARVEEIAANHDKGNELAPADIACLRLLKDELVSITAPATGLTIAYTTMVVGGGRKMKDKQELPADRVDYARSAYPALRQAARWHRRGHYMILASSLVLALMTVSESAKVALGKALLQTRQELRTQQAAITAEKMQIEAQNGNPKGWDADSLSAIQNAGISGLPTGWGFDFCEYARALPRLHCKAEEKWPHSDSSSESGPPLRAYPSPKAMDICERNMVLGLNFGLSLSNMRTFDDDWSRLVGFPFSMKRLPGTAWDGLKTIFQNHGVNSKDTGKPAEKCVDAKSQDNRPPVKSNEDAPKGDDIEWIIAPRLLVIGNYALPMFFSALGAAAFVVLDFYDKVRDSRLAPRDHWLGWVRLTLGLIVGSCIGLFASSSSPAAASPDQGLIGALTLSASGLAFLAGFGVEGVFGLLNTLVKRVFETVPDQKSAS